MREPRLVALHPVDVAVDGVDLAVMGEHAKGLREAPGGEGISRVALVIDREAADEACIQQIRVEFRQRGRQEHALVDERTCRERAQVQFRDLGRDRLLLDPAADHEQVALHRRAVALLGVPQQDLLDLGPRGVRLLADALDVDRHLAPAIDQVATGEDFGLDDLAAALLRAEIGLGQEGHAHRDTAGLKFVAAALHRIGEEILRDLDMDAGTIAGLAIGIDSAAVPDGLERIDARLHHLAPRLAVERGDEAHAAGIMLGHVDMGVLRQRGRAGLVAVDEFLSGFHTQAFHHRHSAATARDAPRLSMNLCISAAASRPSRMPQTTSDAPRTMSPAAKTPGSAVIMLR